MCFDRRCRVTAASETLRLGTRMRHGPFLAAWRQVTAGTTSRRRSDATSTEMCRWVERGSPTQTARTPPPCPRPSSDCRPSTPTESGLWTTIHLNTHPLSPSYASWVWRCIKSTKLNNNLFFANTFAICCRPSVCRPSVCNARVPYSGGWNFLQYFYGIRYLGHPLTSTENFTEIVPGETLRRGS